MQFTITVTEEEEAYQLLKAREAFAALHEIQQELFRPARKHGYPDTNIQELLNKAGDAGVDLIRRLEVEFFEILQERGLRLD